jgi:5-methylcytosine-specific restriction endonuclease McrA
MSIRFCSKCGKEFIAITNKKYCDVCMTHKCLCCGKEFADKNQIGRKYCSYDCARKMQLNPNPKKEKLTKTCLFCGNIFYVHEYRKLTAKFCSQRCLAKSKTRESSKNWRGGICPENHRIRYSEEMKNWRVSVFERDKYTCQICGIVGGKLNAHHIIPFSVDKSLRFDLLNGITLCVACHKKQHKNIRRKNGR